ncbi:MAG: IclR family transcriptional regulator [Rhizobiaceae bacterium]|nr:IclR family transcriptional regulator [Rhizobiaceae bacterium]
MAKRAATLSGGRDGRDGVQVIARAAAVLRALKGSAGMSLGQIAEKVDLPRSTVQRIVGALQQERLLTASGSASGVRLGPELHALSEAARVNVVNAVRPLLQRLSAQTEETVDLSMLRDGKMVFVDQIPGSHRLRAISAVGETFPLATTANGRACLSLMDDAEARELLAAEAGPAIVRRTLATIAEVRSTGLAFDEDEHTQGISAVGLGFVDPKGDRYAISVPVPTSRFTQQRERVAAALRLLRGPIGDMFG